MITIMMEYAIVQIIFFIIRQLVFIIVLGYMILVNQKDIYLKMMI